nr:unnamed protein product [Digitaria exilis]
MLLPAHFTCSTTHSAVTLEITLVLRPRRAAAVNAFPAFPPPDICN